MAAAGPVPTGPAYYAANSAERGTDSADQRIGSFVNRPAGTRTDGNGNVVQKFRIDWHEQYTSPAGSVCFLQSRIRAKMAHMWRMIMTSQCNRRVEQIYLRRAAAFHHDTELACTVALGGVVDWLVSLALGVVAGDDSAAGALFNGTTQPTQPIRRPPAPRAYCSCQRDTPDGAPVPTTRGGEDVDGLAGHRCYSYNCRRRTRALIDVPPLPLATLLDGSQALVTKDFASQMKARRLQTATCDVPTGTNIMVSVVRHSPRLVAAASMPEKTRASREAAGVISELVQKTTAVYGMSTHKNDAAMMAWQADNVFSAANDGVMPGSGAGWVAYRGHMLPGSVVYGPADDADDDVHLAGDADRMATHAQPVRFTDAGKIDCVNSKADGAGHFQANAATKGHNVVAAEHGVRMVHSRTASAHAKDMADVLGNLPDRHQRKALKSKNPYQPGFQHAAMRFAEDCAKPRFNAAAPETPVGLNTLYDSIVCYATAADIEEKYAKKVATATKVVGIMSLYGRTSGKVEGGTRALVGTHLACACNNCVALQPQLCYMRHSDNRLPDAPRGFHFKTMRHVDDYGVATDKSNLRGGGIHEDFVAWATTLKAGDTVATVLDPLLENGAQRFYLAKLRGKAFLNEEDCSIAGNDLEAGWWLVEFDWYERERAMNNGNYVYRLDEATRPITYQANALLRGCQRQLSKGFSWDGKQHVLTGEAEAWVATHCKLS